jgi:predicted lactoylglutathione lyase
MIQVSSKGTARNQAFRAYYERRIAEGKNGKQVLICISRRLVNIIYGMLKNGTEYRMPEVKESKRIQLKTSRKNIENVMKF